MFTLGRVHRPRNSKGIQPLALKPPLAQPRLVLPIPDLIVPPEFTAICHKL